jgi:hypothetical protein
MAISNYTKKIRLREFHDFQLGVFRQLPPEIMTLIGRELLEMYEFIVHEGKKYEYMISINDNVYIAMKYINRPDKYIDECIFNRTNPDLIRKIENNDDIENLYIDKLSHSLYRSRLWKIHIKDSCEYLKLDHLEFKIFLNELSKYSETIKSWNNKTLNEILFRN